MKQEITQKQRLRKMKIIATGTLVFMVLVLILSKLLYGSNPIFPYVFAFSEAAVIGALADWFAVVALFKHPMGMRFIPHTAIIPKNKSVIAKSLGSFVKDNFLSRDNIKTRINISFSTVSKKYLEDNREAVLGLLSNNILPTIIQMIDDMKIVNYFGEHALQKLRKVRITPVIGELLDHVMTDDRYSSLVRDFLGVLRDFLKKDKEQVKQMIQRELPAALSLMPSLSEILSDKILNAIDNFLSKKIDDEGNENGDYVKVMETGLKNFIENLKNSQEYIDKGEEIKQNLLAKPEIIVYIDKTWSDIKELILSDLNSENSKTKGKLQKLLEKASEIIGNSQVSNEIDEWFINFIIDYVENNKEKFAKFIEDTINNWDETEVSQKLELQVGSDLQYIRLNGTIIGGLAGLCLKIILDFVTTFGWM